MQPDYSHLRRLAVNAGEITVEELTKDAQAFLNSGPSIAELGEYCSALGDIIVAFEYWVEDIADLRRKVAAEFMREIDRIAAELPEEQRHSA